MQTTQNIRFINYESGTINNCNNSKKLVEACSEMFSESSNKKELSYRERNLFGNLNEPGLEELYLRELLLKDQQNLGIDSVYYNRHNDPVTLLNPMELQQSMYNPIGNSSAMENPRQLVITSPLPQFTSFGGDSWKEFIQMYTQYAISIGINCMSISDVTTLACKQQSTMFFDANIGD